MLKRVIIVGALLLATAPFLASAQISCPNLTRALSRGSSGNDVSALQRFFTGEYSNFLSITGYFGPITEAAVKQWQKEHNIVSYGTPSTTGWGAIGPRTRAAITVMCASGTGAAGNTENPNHSATQVTSTPTPIVPTTTVFPNLPTSPITTSSATFSASPTSGAAPLSVSFNATVANGDYAIEFGDGQYQSLENSECSVSLFPIGSLPLCFSHIYASAGTYTAKLETDTCPDKACLQTLVPTVLGTVTISVTGATAHTCLAGTTGTYPNCVSTTSSCSFNGQSIAHGSSVTAYQSSSVAFGNQCISETRACSNGTLSGSYTNASCSAGAAQSCTLNGTTVAHGSSRAFYSDAAISYGDSCTNYAQTRSCSNGTLSGDSSHQYASCTVGDPNACSFNNQTMTHGGSVTAYQARSVPFGQNCVSELRSCSNGALSGSYQYPSCSTLLLSLKCTVNTLAEMTQCVSRVNTGTATEIEIGSMMTCADATCNFRLDGVSGPVSIHGKTGVAGGFVHPTSNISTAVLSIYNSQQVTISNLIFRDPGTYPGAIYTSPIVVVNSAHVVLNHLTMFNPQVMGVEFSGDTDVTVQNSVFVNAAIDALWFDGTPGKISSGIVIRDNFFADSRAPAIEFTATNSSIARNIFVHNHRDTYYHACGSGTDPCPGGQLGVEPGTDGLTFQGNVIRDGKIDAYAAVGLYTGGLEFTDHAVHNVMVTGNDIHNNTGSGIYGDLDGNGATTDIVNITISGNKAYGNDYGYTTPEQGIFFKQPAGVSVHDNCATAGCLAVTLGKIWADPNPCVALQVGGQCTSTIHWVTNDAENVRVQAGETYNTFALGVPSGSQDAPWIPNNTTGTIFKLYSGDTLLDTTVVYAIAPTVASTHLNSNLANALTALEAALKAILQKFGW